MASSSQPISIDSNKTKSILTQHSYTTRDRTTTPSEFDFDMLCGILCGFMTDPDAL